MIRFLTTEFATTVKLFQPVARPMTFYACYEPSSLNSFLFALNQTKRSLLLMLLVVQPCLGQPAAEIFYVYMTFVLLLTALCHLLYSLLQAEQTCFRAEKRGRRKDSYYQW